MTTSRREGRSPSVIAFILIALGVIWLLFEAKVFSSANLVVLFRLWPVVLIAIGLELLFGRESRSLSLLIGLGTVILLLLLMIAGPAFGLAPTAETKTASFSEPLGDTTSAQVNLDLSVGRTVVQALSDSNNLFTADLRYVGDVDFHVSTSDTEKFVVLTSKNDSVQWFDFLGLSLVNNGDDLLWNIGLAPNIPLDVRLNGGVGDSDVNLSGVQLSRLSYNTGVGNATVSLPSGESYSIDLNGGVGNTMVNFADGAAVTASVDAGVGNIVLDVPDNAPVRLESNGGLGNVNVLSGLNQVSGSDEGLSKNGVWETSSYAAAGDSARIVIHYNGGVGNLTVR